VDKLFPPGLKLNVTFIKNDPKWFLLSNEVNPSYNIKFEALELIFHGSTIVSWNLIADKKGAMFERFGGIDLHLEFKKPLAERVTVILWGIYDDVLRITPDKRFETSTT